MCACVHWAWTAASNVARVARVARVASCSGGCRSRCITGKRRQGHASDAKGAFIVPPPCCVCDRVCAGKHVHVSLPPAQSTSSQGGSMSMLVISAAQALDMKVHCCAQPPHVSRNGCWCLLADVAAVPLQKAATVIGTTRKKIRMASPEQVYEATGCLTGAVPPFGSPFNIPTFIDDSVIEQGETINFNAVRCDCSRASVARGRADRERGWPYGRECAPSRFKCLSPTTWPQRTPLRPRSAASSRRCHRACSTRCPV